MAFIQFIKQYRLFLLLMFFLAVTVSITGQEKNAGRLDNPVSVSWLKKNLTKQHPRLVLNDETEKLLREKLNNDPVTQNVYHAIKINAENVLQKPLINLDTPLEQRTQDNQLDISREMLYRMNMLAMVYRISKDRRMLKRINEEVISPCNFP